MLTLMSCAVIEDRKPRRAGGGGGVGGTPKKIG